MAKIIGIPPFTGTHMGVCIYRMRKQYYLRMASSLTGKRVKKDRAFKKTMQYAALLAKASTIGSAVYAALLPHKKQHALYRKLTGEAMRWLQYQWTAEDIIDHLIKQYAGPEMIIPKPKTTRLRASFAHKTPRLRPYTKGLKRKLRQSLKAIPDVKTFYSLDAYRCRERAFRKEYNKALTTYPWAEHLS